MVNGTQARTTTVLYVVVVVVAVLIGTVFAPVVWGAASQVTASDTPEVVVITLEGATDDRTASAVTKDLREARDNGSVEAVVLRIDSNGGPVSPSEELYLAVNRTAREMPVVAYVEGAAASGGYFTIAPSDEIVVKPSSRVGSIGVIVQADLGTIERAGAQSETFVRTGPDKAQISKDGIREQLETLHNAFTNAVMRHRSDAFSRGPVELTRQDVMAGQTYLGPTAVENGFADRVGDIGVAISRAAELSDGISGDDYDVTYKDPPGRQISIVLSGDGVERDGNVVYVDSSEEDVPFREPVRFYAVRGVPTETGADAGTGVEVGTGTGAGTAPDSGEVTVNASG